MQKDIGYSINPLPPDYDSLSPEEKKEARLRVVRDHSSPLRFQLAWACFREWYLKSSESFYKAKLESPDFHYDIVQSVARNRRNIVAAPRGSAKSTVGSEELPLFLALTRTNRFDTTICTATAKMVEDRIDRIRNELETNEALIHDFGEQKPKKGKGKWNMSALHLANGNSITGTSVTSRNRGARPDMLIFDDPEFDPKGEVAAEALSAEFEVLLFKVFLPMLEKGSGILWIGTMISRKSYLYKACSGEDKRFNLWDRKILAAAELAPGSSLDDEVPQFVNFLWENKWSQDELVARLKESGAAHFSSEYLNAPTSSGSRLLTIDPKRNTYFIAGGIPHGLDGTAGSRVVYQALDIERHSYVSQDMDYDEWISGLCRVILVDYAYTQNVHSDYSCCICVGFDRNDVAWILDAWHGKVTSDALNMQIVAMGSKWNAHVVCPESAAIQQVLVDNTRKYMQESAPLTKWMPRVMPPNPPAGISKAVKISTMEWRYRKGRIKFPMNPEFSEDNIHFKMLYQQIADFTMDLSLLPHDDLVDTLGMLSFVNRIVVTPQEVEPVCKTARDKILNGEMVEPLTGLSYLSLMNGSEIDDECISAVLESREEFSRRRHHRPPRRRIRR